MAVDIKIYLHLAMKHGVTIEPKFVVAGHTQMECDSMHSLIEWRIIKDIHTPRDYIVIFETARMHPSLYKVTQLYHNDFMKLSGAYVTNLRPGKKVGDPTVHDPRALQYLADGRIRYKLDFESDLENLPQRISIPKEPSKENFTAQSLLLYGYGAVKELNESSHFSLVVVFFGLKHFSFVFPKIP